MRGPFLLTILLVIAPGCGSSAPDSRSATPSARQPGQSPESPKRPADPPADVARTSGATPAPDAAQERQRPAPSLFEALGLVKAMPGLPAGLVLGGDCPPASGQVEGEIADQAQARIPLKVGLTLVNLWKPTEAEEYECLTQVTAIQRDAIDLTMRCNRPGSERTLLRRICRSDLTSARMLHTGVGVVTVIGDNGEELPETIVGATEFSLSRRVFAELKSSGQMSHHYVQIGGSDRLEWEARATLHRDGTDTAEIAINGSPVKLPVIRASGATEITNFGKVERGRVTAVVVDDERFPMLVDYIHTVDGSSSPRFRLHFPKVTYPGTDAEGELARRGRLIVHGIYFDFNSDRIRTESDPILTELGQALARHPDWTLSINGHTDNVGGDAYNLALSVRRAAAVRRALVERHGILAERLRSAGFGASSPIEPNDTPEGRARNRRVELVRVEALPAEPPRP